MLWSPLQDWLWFGMRHYPKPATYIYSASSTTKSANSNIMRPTTFDSETLGAIFADTRLRICQNSRLSWALIWYLLRREPTFSLGESGSRDLAIISQRFFPV